MVAMSFLMVASSLVILVCVSRAWVVRARCLSRFLLSCALWSLRSIVSLQPTPWYLHWMISSGQCFLCSLISFRQMFSAEHLLEHAIESFGHCCICLPWINECFPSSRQWGHFTVRYGHSFVTCWVKWHRRTISLQPVEHFTSSYWHPSGDRDVRWLVMVLSSPCHLQPFSLLGQYIWRLHTSRSTCLFLYSLYWPRLVARHMQHVLLSTLLTHDMQNTCPQHSVMWGLRLGRRHILQIKVSAGGYR